MYTTNRHKLPHARMAWHGILADQCLLSGTGYVNINNLVSTFSYDDTAAFCIFFGVLECVGHFFAYVAHL
jgi:hypothetical protein